MGQAKNRGTKEQRIEEGVQKRLAKMRKHEELRQMREAAKTPAARREEAALALRMAQMQALGMAMHTQVQTKSRPPINTVEELERALGMN